MVQGRRRTAPGVERDELHDAGLRLVRGDRRLGDLRQPQEHRLDLGQLDPVSADLHLAVDAAQILDLPVVVDPAEVSGPVDPSRRVVRNAQEVGDEGPGGQVGPVDVSRGEADAGDPDFTGHAPRQCPLVLAEDHHRVGRQGYADRHRLVGGEPGPGGGDGRLGRAVDVEQCPARTVPAADEARRAGFAGDEDEPEPGQLLVDRGQQRRYAAERRDAVPDEKGGEVPTDQRPGRRAGHQRRAGDQRHPDLLHREVEGDRHPLVDAVVRAQAVGLRRDPDEVADARLVDGDALGPARGPRGVDDVGQLVRRRSEFVPADPVCPVEIDVRNRVHPDHRGVHPIQALRQGREGEDRADARVGDDEGDPVRRETDVQRHVGRVDLADGEHGEVREGRLVNEQPDPVPRDTPRARRWRAS